MQELANHVERGGLWHAALLPPIDGALAHAAELAELARGEAELGAGGPYAGRVVHDFASIVKDDGLAVRAGCVVDGDAHGSAPEDCGDVLDGLFGEVAGRAKSGLAGVAMSAGDAYEARVVSTGCRLWEPEDEVVAPIAYRQGSLGIFGGHF